MIFSPRLDKFPELLHQCEPMGDLLRAAHERRVEVDFLRAGMAPLRCDPHWQRTDPADEVGIDAPRLAHYLEFQIAR